MLDKRLFFVTVFLLTSVFIFIGAQTEGPGLEQMNAFLGKIGLKASALWTFNIKEVYDESAGPNAGKQIA